MKKLLILAIFCASGYLAQSQIQVGIKGGLNYSDFHTDNITSNVKSGYHFGGFVNFKITKFSVQPEIIFSQQGSDFRFNGKDLESNFNYINIPVMFKLYLIGGLNIQAGPQFGFLTSANSEFNPIDQLENENADIKDYYSNSDVSLSLGIGWDLPLNLNVDFRYNKGLTDISNESIPLTKNQVFQLSVGFRFID